MTIRVLLADDQELVRAGLRMIIDDADDMQVVAEASDGATAVALAQDLRPDVCLLDIQMPRLDGLEATRRLAGPGVPHPLKVVVVTTFELDEYAHTALRNGAAGFLLKHAGPVLLLEAIRAAHRGDVLVSPSITIRLLEHFGGSLIGNTAPEPALPLTEREEEVLRSLARGRSNREIAGDLHISMGTVKTHLSNLQDKVGARNRVELAAFAWESGRMRPALKAPRGGS